MYLEIGKRRTKVTLNDFQSAVRSRSANRPAISDVMVVNNSVCEFVCNNKLEPSEKGMQLALALKDLELRARSGPFYAEVPYLPRSQLY